MHGLHTACLFDRALLCGPWSHRRPQRTGLAVTRRVLATHGAGAGPVSCLRPVRRAVGRRVGHGARNPSAVFRAASSVPAGCALAARGWTSWSLPRSAPGLRPLPGLTAARLQQMPSEMDALAGSGKQNGPVQSGRSALPRGCATGRLAPGTHQPARGSKVVVSAWLVMACMGRLLEVGELRRVSLRL